MLSPQNTPLHHTQDDPICNGLKTQTMKCTGGSPLSCSPLLLWESTLRKRDSDSLSDSRKPKTVFFIFGAQKLTKKGVKV